ncbi:hypothetical protein CEXT_213711 [Caerostris extrusa]|uniref:Uncharacterized protein n=1 Tax=Caerostris extrusa TaxID=172846 RepID=A0AAV4X9L3_CAEEX|nr:hypothetical protein CEXT_213711 [Caerostris extrusa]
MSRKVIYRSLRAKTTAVSTSTAYRSMIGYPFTGLITAISYRRLHAGHLYARQCVTCVPIVASQTRRCLNCAGDHNDWMPKTLAYNDLYCCFLVQISTGFPKNKGIGMIANLPFSLRISISIVNIMKINVRTFLKLCLIE